jgi:transcriptional regulator with XRE-family HTH domain
LSFVNSSGKLDDVTNDEASETPSDVVGSRLRQLRKQRALSIEQVADLCAEAGAPELTANALYLIEGGRRKSGRRTRKVTVDELLALGAAFNVSPLTLLPGAETWEAMWRLVRILLMDRAASGEPDYDVIPQAVPLAHSLGLITLEDSEAVLRVFQATAARRKANYDATKGASDGE